MVSRPRYFYHIHVNVWVQLLRYLKCCSHWNFEMSHTNCGPGTKYRRIRFCTILFVKFWTDFRTELLLQHLNHVICHFLNSHPSIFPGTVPMETYNVRYTGKDELRSAVLCLKCNSIKPERAHHCSVSYTRRHVHSTYTVHTHSTCAHHSSVLNYAPDLIRPNLVNMTFIACREDEITLEHLVMVSV